MEEQVRHFKWNVFHPYKYKGDKNCPKKLAMSPSKWEMNWQGPSLYENITLNQNQISKTLQVIDSIFMESKYWNIEKNDSEMFKKWNNLIKWQC